VSIMRLRNLTVSHWVNREVAGHRGRSYVFNLNETLSLDSSYQGNPSRFVDHVGASSSSGEKQCNCRALSA
jgi:histone-lysine N-methyltransferase EZH2